MNIDKTSLFIRKNIDLLKVKNENVYEIIKKRERCEKPNGFLKWERKFETIDLSYEFKQSLHFNFKYIEDNKIKMFRWKLMHYILPCKELLFQWRIKSDKLCILCNETENYQHFFFDCSYVKEFWKTMEDMLTKMHISKHVLNLKNLVLGYKSGDACYYDLNLVLTYMYFAIYKAYYLSNCKEEKINITNIFKNEINNIIESNNILNKKNGPFPSKM